MQISAYLSEENFEIENIETKCEINLVDLVIVSSHLVVQAKIKGINNEKFQEIVTKAEKNCLISKLYNTVITSEATLL